MGRIRRQSLLHAHVRLALGVQARADAEDVEGEDVTQRKSNEDQMAEIERQFRLFCFWCGQRVDDQRVYFGVKGPFCGVGCRDEYARTP